MAGSTGGRYTKRKMRQIREMQVARSHWIYDFCRPNNPNIPFFASDREYKNRILPALPSEVTPDRDRPWLVEPGLCSIEVYEAILKKSRRRSPPLTRYICRSGVVQWSPSPRPYAPASAAEDRRLREERDICFTLLSGDEGLRIIEWLHPRGASTFPSYKLATPLGLAATVEGLQDERARHSICRELGIGSDGAGFPRSALPPGVIAIGGTNLKEWELPGAGGIARDGRATDDCGIRRIEWPARRDS